MWGRQTDCIVLYCIVAAKVVDGQSDNMQLCGEDILMYCIVLYCIVAAAVVDGQSDNMQLCGEDKLMESEDCGRSKSAYVRGGAYSH